MQFSDDYSLQPSCIVLDSEALAHNIRFLRTMGANGVKISSVIKGNAYGHGIPKFLPLAEQNGVDHFSVFSADEARIALNSRTNPDTDIMIMGMIRDSEMDWAIENDIEFYVFERDRLQAAIQSAQKREKKAQIHLQIETGMNRTGFERKNWEPVLKMVADNRESIDLKGICTHYAGAESVANHYRIQKQNKTFKEFLSLAESVLEAMPPVHASSSAAYITRPEMHYDMVRVGIAQYGFWPSRETYMHYMKSNGMEEGEDPLRRVLTWKSEVMSLKKVESGEFIGYGTVFLAGRDMTIATVPIGYSHGFGRNLTNTGYVLVNGERAGVVGLVNMNMITLNVSHIEDVNKGDEVVMIGHQGDDAITVASFGEMTNNLNYEVLVRLPASIPRMVK